MTTTTQFDVTNQEWTEVATGSTKVIVQIMTDGLVGIHVGASAPEGDWTKGMILRTQFMAFPFFDISESDKVFVRAADASETVNVLKT